MGRPSQSSPGKRPCGSGGRGGECGEDRSLQSVRPKLMEVNPVRVPVPGHVNRHQRSQMCISEMSVHQDS